MLAHEWHDESDDTKVVLCLVLLVLSPADSKSSQKKICDINLKIHKDFPESDSETQGGNGNIHARSLSPWNWTTHTCPHQIPRVIFEAECQNHYCTDPNSNLQTELNSVPIYHYMLVLQQDKQDRCVTVSYQKVAVGCTCVWAQSS
ncbi:interleukin-17F-like [Astyanax mexicanus]|uniref:Interleukin-17F-like n=1 Tax=Astyanax mexicanus TaxID=7994 RepID=A0A8T2LJD1_ASTMX|nr:interleukin-17F-like [Astyanax mexicanus]